MSKLTRILHVDDDSDIREIARLSLEDLGGFVLLQCANAAQALEKAEKFKPDLLLLDLKLPDVDGASILQELRKIKGLAQVPAIYLTAKAMLAEQIEALECEVIGVILKPFDPIALPGEILEKFAAQA
ncbi:MAG: response regulator [Alphaproteobacteria bacterium]|nr:response regulator [Alphaproteobacteria bacterium]